MAPRSRKAALKSPRQAGDFLRETTNNADLLVQDDSQEHDENGRSYVGSNGRQRDIQSSFPHRTYYHTAAASSRPGFEWLTADVSTISSRDVRRTSSVKTSAPPGSRSPIVFAWRDKDELRKNRKRAVHEYILLKDYLHKGVLVVVVVVALYATSRVLLRGRPARTVPVATIIESSKGFIFNRTSYSISFRDQLEEGTNYLTSPLSGTFADQTMVLYHLTYLATVLDRIPVVPPFVLLPDVNNTQPTPRASALYDVRLFARSANVSLIDWDEIRSPIEGTVEPLGCWIGTTAAEAIQERSMLMKDVGLSISFYPMRVAIPSDVKGLNDLQTAYAILAGFDADALAQRGLMDQAAHTSSITTLYGQTHVEPDKQMMCIDYTLFHTSPLASDDGPRELDQYEHTAFLSHGQHLRFAPSVAEMGKGVVNFLLGAQTTQFIAVHIPMDPSCLFDADRKSCVPSLAPFASAVERIRGLTKAFGKRSREQRHQARVLSVIVSTDVDDLAFLGELEALDWILLDHGDLEVRERYGTFTPEVVESVVHSRAVGFVGRRGDSASTLAALRVRTWKKGLSVLL